MTAGIQRWQTGLIKAQSFSPITAAHWSLRQDRALDRPAEEWSDCRPRGRIPGQREGTEGAPLICLRCIWFLSTKSRGGRPALIVHSYVHEREISPHSFDPLFWWAGECVIWASQLLKLIQHAEETFHVWERNSSSLCLMYNPLKMPGISPRWSKETVPVHNWLTAQQRSSLFLNGIH